MIKEELNLRLNWLIKLRWMAVGAVLLTISSSYLILRMVLPYKYLYLGGIILFLYNLLFYLYNRKIRVLINTESWQKKANRFANIQISIDLMMLVYLLHFSGGLENPFVFYFVFHMVIASILLSNREAYLQATLAAVLFGE